MYFKVKLFLIIINKTIFFLERINRKNIYYETEEVFRKFFWEREEWHLRDYKKNIGDKML